VNLEESADKTNNTLNYNAKNVSRMFSTTVNQTIVSAGI